MADSGPASGPASIGRPDVWIRGRVGPRELPRKRPTRLKTLALRLGDEPSASPACPLRFLRLRQKKMRAASRAAPAIAPTVAPATAPLEMPDLICLGISFDCAEEGIADGVEVMKCVTTDPPTVTAWADVTTSGVGVIVATELTVLVGAWRIIVDASLMTVVGRAELTCVSVVGCVSITVVGSADDGGSGDADVDDDSGTKVD